MKKQFAIVVVIVAVAVGATLRAAAPTARPEDVGLSADRLKRVTELMQRHIDAGNISGAVTLIARNGRVAHLAAQGLMDIETRKPMATDAE